MIEPAYDIFERDGFSTRAWVEGVRDLEAANHRIIELSASSPGKYVVVRRATGQIVSSGTAITSSKTSEPASERYEPKAQTTKGANSTRKVSSHVVPSHSDAESETLWR